MVSFALHAQEVRRALPGACSRLRLTMWPNFLQGLLLPPGRLSLPCKGVSMVFRACDRARAPVAELRSQLFSKMRAWSATELAPRIPMNLPVYYFSGDPMPLASSHFFPMPRSTFSADLNRWAPFPRRIRSRRRLRGRVGPFEEIGGKHPLIWAFHYEGHEGRAGSHGFSWRASVDLHVYSLDWRRDCLHPLWSE